MIIFPEEGETSSSFLLRRGKGRAMILLNVKIDGQLTSVCENTKDSGAWITKEGKAVCGLLCEYKNVEVLPNTLSLSCSDVTKLAQALPAVSEALERHCGRYVALGSIRRNDPMMLTALTALESIIEIIRRSIGISLTTDIFGIRRGLKTNRVSLFGQNELSSEGKKLLEAFDSSLDFYANLPELRKFTGKLRGVGDSLKKGGEIIIKMLQGCQSLKLPSGEQLNYVEYELKPLRVEKILNWTCPVSSNSKSDPRRDSVDVLMEYKNAPVFIEIKAKNDRFCSYALTQVLYYGCILTAERQRRRLSREFVPIDNLPGWLCVIAEDRGKRVFDNDELQTVQFLQHPDTVQTLAPYFKGAFIVIVNVTGHNELSVVRSTSVRFGTTT